MTVKEKYISVEEALKKIKSNDSITLGAAASEPLAILEKLHTISYNLENITITSCLTMKSADYLNNSECEDCFQINNMFYTQPIRAVGNNKNVSFVPGHLHALGLKRLNFQKPNIYIGTATPPDKHGNISLSLSNVYEKSMIENADLVILEVNSNYPRTFGDTEIHIDNVDFLVEVDYSIPELPDVPPNEKDLQIGKHISRYINDGDCIQLGIGGIPNAVAAALADKKNLGVHTEMLTTGLMKLAKLGVINGSQKNIHKDKIVCTFALGTKELYDFIDDNPSILIKCGYWVNDPYIIGMNDNQVSINTTLEIDFTGQCASESIGTMQYSGTGGQADTAIGAQRSKNGKSFIALYSSANIKVKGCEKRKTISTIVPMLKPGAIVSLSRNDVDYVVTEYGVAELRGTSISERVLRLINIAHPDFREGLIEEARKLNYIK
jgi:acyl-CoA hydrolase